MQKALGSRDELWLFLTTFLVFAWFHQGGGWNQNPRFALVRSIVENGSFFIDSHLVYLLRRPGDTKFERPLVRRGELEFEGRTYALGWPGEGGRIVPIAGTASPGALVVDVGQAAVSGDIAYYDGHFHPGKAPGTSFLAVPAYFLVYNIGRAFGFDPDEWRTLTINAWLTSVLSVGLLSAIGIVLFHRLALRVSGEDRLAALLASLTLAFGTMFLPQATMLSEHNVVAVVLVASWYFARLAREANGEARGLLVFSGLCAGYAAITNYFMVFAVLILAAYTISARKQRGWLWFGLGVLAPFLLICVYNVVCFGTPFTTNYRYEQPMFLTKGALFGVFGVPNLSVLVAILFSPFRGLFITAPVLIMSVVAAFWFSRMQRFKADALLCAGIVALLFLFNIVFISWDGGWGVGPRYVAPALPFLAIPLVFAYQRAARLTVALACLSIGASLVVTAVDPQAPTITGVLAATPERRAWTYSPLTEYELPLLLTGRAAPLLSRLEAAMARQGQRRPLTLANVTGHVSVNPVGVYEPTYFTRFGPNTVPARWNSFNVGELVAPGSVLSLLPLLVLAGGGASVLIRRAREAARPERNAGMTDSATPI